MSSPSPRDPERGVGRADGSSRSTGEAASDGEESPQSTWQGLAPGFVRAAAADRLKALAHPDRLRIVEALAGGPRTVSQLAAAVGRPLNMVSRNLRVLRDARVVQCSKRGNSVLYVLGDRDVARLAAVAYRGAGGQLRKVVSLAPTVAELGAGDTRAGEPDSSQDQGVEGVD